MSEVTVQNFKKVDWHEELVPPECAKHLHDIGFVRPSKFFYVKKGDELMYSNAKPTEPGVECFAAYTLTEIKYWLADGFMTGRELATDPKKPNEPFYIWVCYTNHPMKLKMPAIQVQGNEAEAAGAMLHALIVHKHVDVDNTHKLKMSNIISLHG